MRRIVVLYVGLVFSLLVSMAEAQRQLPASLMHALLLRAGYIQVGDYPGRLGTYIKLFSAGVTKAGYEVDYAGNLKSVAVFMYDPHDVAFYQALGIGYVTIQTSMGKLGNILDAPVSTLVRKGRYLMDVVTHNLRHLETTRFNFDDMVVVASKNEQERSILIILAPQF